MRRPSRNALSACSGCHHKIRKILTATLGHCTCFSDAAEGRSVQGLSMQAAHCPRGQPAPSLQLFGTQPHAPCPVCPQQEEPGCRALPHASQGIQHVAGTFLTPAAWPMLYSCPPAHVRLWLELGHASSLCWPQPLAPDSPPLGFTHGIVTASSNDRRTVDVQLMQGSSSSAAAQFPGRRRAASAWVPKPQP